MDDFYKIILTLENSDSYGSEIENETFFESDDIEVVKENFKRLVQFDKFCKCSDGEKKLKLRKPYFECDFRGLFCDYHELKFFKILHSDGTEKVLNEYDIRWMNWGCSLKEIKLECGTVYYA